MHGRGRRLACDRRDGTASTSSTSPTARSAAGRVAVLLPARSATPTATTSLPPPSRTVPSRCSWSASCPTLGVPQIVCDDARDGMARLAAALYGHPSRELAVVGVTGTNGKTTTTLLLAAMLDAAQRPCGLLGTVERRIGGRARGRRADDAGGARPPARPALDDRGGRRGLRDGGLVDRDRAAAARGHEFAAVGFTNLSPGPPRLPPRPGGLLRRQGLALRRALPARRQRRRRLRRAPRGRAALRRRVAIGGCAAARPTSCGPTARSCSCARRSGALSLEPRLRGRFNVDNVLCAVTLALLLDVPLGAIEHAVAATAAPPGRFEPVEAGQGFGVIVDYAHTPAGIAAVLASATAARERPAAVRVRSRRRSRSRQAAADGRRRRGRRRPPLRHERQLALGVRPS